MSQRTIEAFLVDAFATIEATSTAVGRVLVGPNDDATSDESDCAGLADELVRCIREETAKSINLNSPLGHEIQLSDSYPLLKKYLRGVTIYGDVRNESWVQVKPSGGGFLGH